MSVRLLTILLFFLLTAPATVTASDGKIVVYSARKEHLIKPLFEAYTKKTGVKIEYITGKAGALLERLKAEGENSPADLLLTVDAGNLWQAEKDNILQPIHSESLDAHIPEKLRSPTGSWYGLSVRARTLVYNTDTVKPEELSTYEDLSDPKWKGQLILRTSKKVYNQSLVASLIAQHGHERASAIVKGWVNNLAAAPFSNDTKAMQAVAAGLGKVTVVNTYYFGRLKKKKPELPLAIFWPNQKEGGVHMNISGGGVTRYAKHPDSAVKLLEWLAGEEAQPQFAGLNLEYPANPAFGPDPMVVAWGTFNGSPMDVHLYGEKQAEAIKLMDVAGYR